MPIYIGAIKAIYQHTSCSSDEAAMTWREITWQCRISPNRTHPRSSLYLARSLLIAQGVCMMLWLYFSPPMFFWAQTQAVIDEEKHPQKGIFTFQSCLFGISSKVAFHQQEWIWINENLMVFAAWAWTIYSLPGKGAEKNIYAHTTWFYLHT